MKSLLLTGILILSRLCSYAQYGESYTPWSVERLEKTTTVVIIEPGKRPGYHALQIALEKKWDISGLLFLSKEEFRDNHKTYRKSEKYNFLFFHYKTNDSGKRTYRELLFVSDVNKKREFEAENILAKAVTQIDKGEIPFTIGGSIQKDLDMILYTLRDIPNGSPSWEALQNVPAWIRNEQLHISTNILKDPEPIYKAYPYAFKLMSLDDLSQALMERRKNFYYLDLVYYPSNGNKTYLTLFNAETAKPIFHIGTNYHSLSVNNSLVQNFSLIKDLIDIKVSQAQQQRSKWH
jgi:hypothetical protein